MKIIFKIQTMLLVMALFCLNTSCSKESEPDESSSDNTNYATLLPGHWAYSDDYIQEIISFDSKGEGSVVYEYEYYIDDDNEHSVLAKGTYTISGSSLIMNYNDVSVYTTGSSNSVNGFTNKKQKSIKYTIVSIEAKKLVLKDESNRSITFEKYK